MVAAAIPALLEEIQSALFSTEVLEEQSNGGYLGRIQILMKGIQGSFCPLGWNYGDRDDKGAYKSDNSLYTTE